MNLKERFDRIFIDESARGSRLAGRVLDLAPADLVEFVSERPYKESAGTLSTKDYDRSKRQLYITKFKGSFFKQCPGSKGAACCNYFVLNLGLQCDMNCSYCYLQSYLNTPVLTLYSNLDEALSELKVMADSYKGLAYRVGTGETMDSLSLDDISMYSRELIEFFREYPQWMLEFKTKSDKVDQFLDVPHAGNVIVSWSINPQYIVEREEHRTANLSARLAAARKCRAKGFKIAFHIDPMIYHPEWRENYSLMIDEIVENFRPEDVPSITLGALRFQPEQRYLMRERFGMNSLVTRAETHPSRDGKLRYDLELRNEMFQFVIERFKSTDQRWNVWLCMEMVESWITTMKASPREHETAAPFFKPLPKSVPSTAQNAPQP